MLTHTKSAQLGWHTFCILPSQFFQCWHFPVLFQLKHYYWLLLYSTILCSRADSLHSCHMWFWMSDCIIFQCIFLISTEVVYWQNYLVVAWLVSRETAAISAQVLCTPFNHAPVYSVTSFKATQVSGACVFNCNLPAALLAEWSGSFTYYYGNMG